MARSVLIVDDEPNMVLSLEFLMRDQGHEVRVAESGADALKAAAEAPPDLVLLGVGLPDRDGYDVCETLRADARLQAVKIVMVTAKARAVDREKGLAVGADAYVTKPFATRDLVDRVRDLLGEDLPDGGAAP